MALGSDGDDRRVLVYRERLLNGSETFVRDLVDSMSRWRPTLVGLEHRQSTLCRNTDRLVMPGVSATRLRLFKVSRRSRALTEEFSRVNPAVVHAHFGVDAVSVLPTARRNNIPVVVSFHGYDVTVRPYQKTLMSRLYRARLPELFSEAATLVANSDFLAGQLMRLGAPEQKIAVIPPGVKVRSTSPGEHKRRGVLFVGRLVPVKGTADALRAYSALPTSLREEHPLTIAGDGYLRRELEDLAGTLGIKADFTGALSPDEVEQAMEKAAVFIGPSRTDADGATEALGVVFLEAGLAGLPVLAYRSGGIPDTVVSGSSAVLVREGNVEELSVSLASLLCDESRRLSMGAIGREHVLRNFDLRKQTAALEQIYDRAAG